jgi:hypothetical protein
MRLLLPSAVFIFMASVGISVAAIRLIGIGDPLVKRTFAICNANCHVGLALLLSDQYLHAPRALPAIACYAIVAPS